MNQFKYLFILAGLLSLSACTPSVVDKLQQDYVCSDKGGVPDGEYKTTFSMDSRVQCMNGRYMTWWNATVPVDFIEQHKNDHKEK